MYVLTALLSCLQAWTESQHRLNCSILPPLSLQRIKAYKLLAKHGIATDASSCICTLHPQLVNTITRSLQVPPTSLLCAAVPCLRIHDYFQLLSSGVFRQSSHGSSSSERCAICFPTSSSCCRCRVAVAVHGPLQASSLNNFPGRCF